MNRALQILEELTALWEFHEPDHDEGDVPDITSDDTIIQNVTDPKHRCPTCGTDLATGILNPERVQCPGCGHMEKNMGGTALSGLRPRRLDPTSGGNRIEV